MENCCLLVIDVQNDYFDGGTNPLIGSADAAVKAKAILEKFRSEKWPVLFIQHFSVRRGATFFVPGTPGCEIYPLLSPLEGEKVIAKNFPNSFRNTELLETLKSMNINKLVICGMMTHMCVNATTRAAKDFGFDCTVIGDACATKDLEINDVQISASDVHYSFLAAMSYYDAVVMDADLFVKKCY